MLARRASWAFRNENRQPLQPQPQHQPLPQAPAQAGTRTGTGDQASILLQDPAPRTFKAEHPTRPRFTLKAPQRVSQLPTGIPDGGIQTTPALNSKHVNAGFAGLSHKISGRIQCLLAIVSPTRTHQTQVPNPGFFFTTRDFNERHRPPADHANTIIDSPPHWIREQLSRALPSDTIPATPSCTFFNRWTGCATVLGSTVLGSTVLGSNVSDPTSSGPLFSNAVPQSRPTHAAMSTEWQLSETTLMWNDARLRWSRVQRRATV